MSTLWQDLRFAVRTLRKRWMITSLAVLSLALAIGGNAAVFSMVDAFLFRPLPYPEPDRLGVIVHVGLGGAQADVIGDRTTRLAPVSPASAMAMLRETVLLDALVTAEIEPSPLVEVIVEAAQLAAGHPEIAALDLNPVVVSDDGAVVVDAAIELERHEGDTGPIRKLD